jgi:hypothetical protein
MLYISETKTLLNRSAMPGNFISDKIGWEGYGDLCLDVHRKIFKEGASGEYWSGFQRESSKKRINAGSGLGSSLESSESNKEEKEKAEILQT